MSNADDFRQAFNKKYLANWLVRDSNAGVREFCDYLLEHDPLDPHIPRFSATFQSLLGHFSLDGLLASRILEVGSLSPISKFLLHRGGRVETTKGDLRYEIDQASDTYDIVLSLEVVEHLKDQTEKSLAEIVLFNESGIRQFSSEVRRVTRADGHLVLTSPNPCSLLSLQRLLKNEPPTIFRPHVREYTKQELLAIFKEFELIDYKTLFVFGNFEPDTPWKCLQVFGNLSADPNDRGDDHFLLMKRRRS